MIPFVYSRAFFLMTWFRSLYVLNMFIDYDVAFCIVRFKCQDTRLSPRATAHLSSDCQSYFPRPYFLRPIPKPQNRTSPGLYLSFCNRANCSPSYSSHFRYRCRSSRHPSSPHMYNAEYIWTKSSIDSPDRCSPDGRPAAVLHTDNRDLSDRISRGCAALRASCRADTRSVPWAEVVAERSRRPGTKSSWHA